MDPDRFHSLRGVSTALLLANLADSRISDGTLSSVGDKMDFSLFQTFAVFGIFYAFLGNYPTYEFYMPKFLHTYLLMKIGQSVPKRWHIIVRRRGITQKKAHKMYFVSSNRPVGLYVIDRG